MRLIDEGMDEGMDGNEDEDRCLGSLGQFAVVGQRRTDGGRGVQGGQRAWTTEGMHSTDILT